MKEYIAIEDIKRPQAESTTDYEICYNYVIAFSAKIFDFLETLKNDDKIDFDTYSNHMKVATMFNHMMWEMLGDMKKEGECV